jgi:hypothetical protein
MYSSSRFCLSENKLEEQSPNMLLREKIQYPGVHRQILSSDNRELVIRSRVLISLCSFQRDYQPLSIWKRTGYTFIKWEGSDGAEWIFLEEQGEPSAIAAQ